MNDLGEYAQRAGPAAGGLAWVSSGLPWDQILTVLLVLYTVCQFGEWIIIRAKRFINGRKAK